MARKDASHRPRSLNATVVGAFPAEKAGAEACTARVDVDSSHDDSPAERPAAANEARAGSARARSVHVDATLARADVAPSAARGVCVADAAARNGAASRARPSEDARRTPPAAAAMRRFIVGPRGCARRPRKRDARADTETT